MPSRHFKDFVPSTTIWLFYIFVVSDVFTGAVRFYTSEFGILPITYIPKGLLLLLPVLVFVIEYKINIRLLTLLVILIVSIFYGSYNLPTIYQSIFGVWVLVPFVFGVWASRYLLDGAEKRTGFLILLFFLASLGVFLNTVVSYPWVGSTISVGGTSVVASKDLTDYGISRYGGFALASFDAAAQILCFAVWILAYSRNVLFSVFVWFLCGVGIFITTTKGLFASYVLLTFYFLTLPLIKSSKGIRYGWAAILCLFLLLDISLPLYSLGNQTEIRYHTYLQLVVFGSFGDRMSVMWPGSFSLLKGVAGWLLGRGVGGIGDAQEIFEPSQAYAGDNIFVYLTVSFGIIATVFFLGYFTLKSSARFIQKTAHPLAFPFALLVIPYGLVVPIVDWPTLSLIFGMIFDSLVRKYGA